MTLQLLQQFDLADQAVIKWNPAAFPIARIILGGDRTFDAPVPLENTTTLILFVVQDDTGGHTITWDSAFLWPGGTSPTLTATANAVDIIAFVTDGTSMYGVPNYNFS